MQTIGLLIKLAFLLALVLFGALNTQSVKVMYFYGKPPIELPLFVVMMAALFLGILVSFLIALKDKFKLKKEIKQLKKQLLSAESEIKKLRNLPLTDNKEKEKK
jgi:putative membrane protein